MNALKSLAATATLVLAACSAGTGTPTSGPAPTSDVAVEVTNNNWMDMVVYASRDGQRMRLGTVTSMNTVRLKIPSNMARASSGVVLIADPIGSDEGFTTGSIMVHPGEQIRLSLQNYLPISSFAVTLR